MPKRFSVITGASAGLLYILGLWLSWKMGVPALAGFLNFYTWTPIVFLIIGGGAYGLIYRYHIVPDFKSVLQYALLAYLIFELFYATANYGLFGWIDRQLNDQLVEHLLHQTRDKLTAGGAEKTQLEAVEELANAGRLPLTIKQTAIGFGQNLLLDFLKSLFIATITKQFSNQKA